MPAKAPPLRGIRVIDLATPWAEICGRILADLGAEVIKVEPPEGAAARRLAPFGGESDPAPGTSLYWAALGLGKRSVVLDLTTEAGREQLRTLAASADILIESFAPGYLAGLGLGYEALSAANPGLIYTSVSPYGQEGPDARSPAITMFCTCPSAKPTFIRPRCRVLSINCDSPHSCLPVMTSPSTQFTS